MDTNLITRLQKILALTTSPVEGEAQAAAAMLQKLMTEYNLDIADLEARGHKTAPGVKKDSHDLGKAAFKWKLDLAEAIADHYFCHPMINRYAKTVQFVGRPDNVESLKMLYQWIIDQIRAIAATERKAHIAQTGEHIDPLRWQVNFGVGAVERLATRLSDLRAQQASNVTALVLSHKTEISDYLEAQGLRRVDGKETQAQRESRERYEASRAKQQVAKAIAMAAGDMEPYYREYPWERPAAPLTDAEIKAEAKRRAKEDAAWERKQARRNQRSERVRYMSDAEWTKIEQAETSRLAGKRAADKVNLQPFLNGGEVKPAAGALR